MSYIDKYTEMQNVAMAEGDVTLFIHLSFILSKLKYREERRKSTPAPSEIELSIDEEQNQLLDMAGA